MATVIPSVRMQEIVNERFPERQETTEEILAFDDEAWGHFKNWAAERELDISDLVEKRGESSASEDYDPDNYETWKGDQLRDELKSRDLPVSGTNAELVARLEEDDAAA